MARGGYRQSSPSRALRATLRALSQATPGRKIGVFQPHRYSRTQALFSEFANAFPVLDQLFLTDRLDRLRQK